MKKLLFIIALLGITTALGIQQTHAQSNWKTFDNVKVSYLTSYSGAVNYVDPTEDLWMVTIGKEVQKGVYVLLDENRRNTGCVVNLRRSGLSGWWGWLSPKDAQARMTAKQRSSRARGTFHPGLYEIMIKDE